MCPGLASSRRSACPLAGRATVRNLLAVLLDERKHSVSAKTYTADAALPHQVGLRQLRYGDRGLRRT
jgi:hypothetical protein